MLPLNTKTCQDFVLATRRRSKCCSVRIYLLIWWNLSFADKFNPVSNEIEFHAFEIHLRAFISLDEYHEWNFSKTHCVHGEIHAINFIVMMNMVLKGLSDVNNKHIISSYVSCMKFLCIVYQIFISIIFIEVDTELISFQLLIKFVQLRMRKKKNTVSVYRQANISRYFSFSSPSEIWTMINFHLSAYTASEHITV